MEGTITVKIYFNLDLSEEQIEDLLNKITKENPVIADIQQGINPFEN